MHKQYDLTCEDEAVAENSYSGVVNNETSQSWIEFREQYKLVNYIHFFRSTDFIPIII